MSELIVEVLEELPTLENDMQADKCISAIREAQEQKAFWKFYYSEQLKRVNESCDLIIANNTQMLRAYFDTLPHNRTATQQNYRLPSGKLVLKDQEPDYERDDKQIIAFLKKNGGKYIKVKEEVDWSGLKKTLMVIGETAATEGGEIIPGIKVIERPQTFTIEK